MNVITYFAASTVVCLLWRPFFALDFPFFAVVSVSKLFTLFHNWSYELCLSTLTAWRGIKPAICLFFNSVWSVILLVCIWIISYSTHIEAMFECIQWRINYFLFGRQHRRGAPTSVCVSLTHVALLRGGQRLCGGGGRSRERRPSEERFQGEERGSGAVALFGPLRICVSAGLHRLSLSPLANLSLTLDPFCPRKRPYSIREREEQSPRWGNHITTRDHLHASIYHHVVQQIPISMWLWRVNQSVMLNNNMHVNANNR